MAAGLTPSRALRAATATTVRGTPSPVTGWLVTPADEVADDARRRGSKYGGGSLKAHSVTACLDHRAGLPLQGSFFGETQQAAAMPPGVYPPVGMRLGIVGTLHLQARVQSWPGAPGVGSVSAYGGTDVVNRSLGVGSGGTAMGFSLRTCQHEQPRFDPRTLEV